MAAPSQAAKTVFIAGSVLAAFTLAEAVRHPSKFGSGQVYKRMWGIGILTLALGATADFAPALIVPFSVAVVVGFVIKNPGIFRSALGGQTPSSSSSSSSSSPTPATSSSSGGGGGGAW